MGKKGRKKVFLGFSVWHKNLPSSGYALANILWVFDTEFTLAWLCAVSYEKSEVKIYFSKRHVWSRTFEESIGIIFRGTSIKRDNFFAVTENLEGEVLWTWRKEGYFTRRTNLYLFLLAVDQPAVLHSKLLWCELFQAEMRKHTTPFLTQNPFRHVIFVVEMHKTANRSLKQLKDISDTL